MNRRPEFGLGTIPRDCLLCGAVSRGNALCPPCLAALPRLPVAQCPVCASPSAGSAVCGACLAEPPFFQRAVAAVAYRFPVDALIQACKYGGDLIAARALGELLADAVGGEPAPDLIFPMPLHPARLRERGFNQALEIARPVASRTRASLVTDACERVKDTPPQASLPWKKREKNIRGAFACAMDLSGKRIALVDDVMTTGHTLNEAAKALRKGGAAQVYAWAVARTLGQN